ncbi:hypothetical protein ACJZ2D_017191 [Fusarium nematophilum]
MQASAPTEKGTSPQSSESPSTTHFRLFPRLPLELRRRIWYFALLATGVYTGLCVLSSPLIGKIAPLIVCNPYSPLMATCSEARQTAVECCPPTRNYDPETDILYISKENFHGFCDTSRYKEWQSQIRHLALALPVADRGLSLPFALNHLTRLETISVVYPKATGMVDVFDDVSLPKQAHKVLRKFTDHEMDAFRINADYLYEDHQGDLPIVWNRSAREHLDFIRGELTRWLRQQSLRPPCWDDETGSLRLTFDARYFEVADRLQGGP